MQKAAELTKCFGIDILIPTEKSFIAWYNYSFEDRSLTVTLRSGKVYKYSGIQTGNFHQILMAKNKGAWIHKNIMNRGAKTKYVRLDDIPVSIIQKKVNESKTYKLLAQ